ncbi:MAG: hypothetical protein ABR551_09965 [Gemmatimonadales bacterium]
MMSPHVFAFERRLPPWTRPTYRGALWILGLGRGVVGKLYVTALVATLMLLVGVGLGALLFLWMLAVTMVAGAVGGTIHGLLHGLERRGRPGSWLRWVGTLVAAGASAVVLTPQGPFRLGELMTWILAVAVSCLGAGLLVWWDARQPDRLTPHQFHWLQHRDQLWFTRPRPRRHSRPEVNEFVGDT